MTQAVSAVIFNEKTQEVLLIKRRDVPVWVLPGGGIEPEESPEQAVLREVLEETGFHTTIVRKVAFYQPANRLAHPTHFFECRIQSGAPQTGKETKDIQFFPNQELPKLMPFFYQEWIQDALMGSNEVMIKKMTSINYKTLVKFLMIHPILVIRFLLTKFGIHING